MPLILPLTLLLTLPLVSGWGFWGYDPNCAWTRKDAVECFRRHVDTNHDGVITIPEVDAAKERYTGRFMKALAWLVSWSVDVRTEKIVSDCGFDPKLKGFTAQSFINSAKTCIASQAGLCLVKKVCVDADEAEKEAAAAMREVKPPRSWRSWL
jgi:hypothetical protein